MSFNSCVTSTPTRTHLFEGVEFVANPYSKAKSYLRKDVFQSQLTVYCSGDVEYLEDNPVYGTYTTKAVVEIGSCGLIEQTILLTQAFLRTGHRYHNALPEALSFTPKTIAVRDKRNRLVLSGTCHDSMAHWMTPVTDEEECQVQRQIQRLNDQITEEIRADNFYSVGLLRDQVDVLNLRYVDKFWRGFSISTIQTLTATQ